MPLRSPAAGRARTRGGGPAMNAPASFAHHQLNDGTVVWVLTGITAAIAAAIFAGLLS